MRELSAVLTNSHLAKIGDACTDVMPLRWQRMLFVGCSAAVRPVVWSGTLLRLPEKMRTCIIYLHHLAALSGHVPWPSWPVGLGPAAACVPRSHNSSLAAWPALPRSAERSTPTWRRRSSCALVTRTPEQPRQRKISPTIRQYHSGVA